MVTGSMHRSEVVHIGRLVKTTTEGYKLYAPFCHKMQPGNIAYLGVRAGGEKADVSCKRCQSKLASHPHLFKD